jgi:hypothetical protein
MPGRRKRRAAQVVAATRGKMGLHCCERTGRALVLSRALPIRDVDGNNIADPLLIERAFDKARIVNPLRNVGDGDEAAAYCLGRARMPTGTRTRCRMSS